MDKILKSCKIEEPSDLYIIFNDGVDREITSVNLSPEGNVVSVVTPTETLTEGFIVSNTALYVPGLGYLVPGTIIIYQDNDYVLKYGWHTNISNQTIYSWNLESLDSNIPPKTIYKDMINKIDTVHYRSCLYE